MKKILIAVIILALLAFAGYKFLYKDHRDISSEDADFTVSVSELKQEFAADMNAANLKYADKTIAVAGKITAIDIAGSSLMIDGGLSAIMKEPITKIRMTDNVNIKGRFVGYDDLIEELKMDQVSIIK